LSLLQSWPTSTGAENYPFFFLCCILFHRCHLSGKETVVCSYTKTNPTRSFLFSARYG
jgi:hypothetical protein